MGAREKFVNASMIWIYLWALFGMVCFVPWACHGFAVPYWSSTPGYVSKKETNIEELAVAKAEAEYRCTEVRVEKVRVHYVRLSVCGARRWYDCSAYSCSEVYYKDRPLFRGSSL